MKQTQFKALYDILEKGRSDGGGGGCPKKMLIVNEPNSALVFTALAKLRTYCMKIKNES